MSSFRYKAVNPAGDIRKGIVYGASEIDVEQRLRATGYELLLCQESKIKLSPIARTRLTTKELINFVFQLEQLLKAGVPLLDALQDLRDGDGRDYYKDLC